MLLYCIHENPVAVNTAGSTEEKSLLKICYVLEVVSIYTEPWTICIWTSWVHLNGDFFNSKYIMLHNPQLVWIQGYETETQRNLV